ncbi:hypothetical protein K0T92_08020 [Paenibacillus oenotherae]|uniref:Uncharacterized protein n=1 Tax=Paenibacillus oenotherae TaxID=1435645 RepID=A0ABS7D435_9BACL|nr:hypothetical protein [Paenibacillus oenotherae]MBW7474689.1 hypothetical protein [Paenibacillus oenotherae]
MQDFRLKEALKGKVPAIRQAFRAKMVHWAIYSEKACSMAGFLASEGWDERKAAFSQEFSRLARLCIDWHGLDLHRLACMASHGFVPPGLHGFARLCIV